MKILITGASGYFCEELIAQLSLAGHELRLSDIVHMETEHEFVNCSVTEFGALALAMEGVDAVFHTVVGGRRYPPDSPVNRAHTGVEHFNTTVMGTFNILQLAGEMGIGRVVMIGSEAARGQRIPPTDWEVCDEWTPARPDYVYALAKYVMEPISEYATRIDGVETAVLRNAWFGAANGKSVTRMGTSLLFQRSALRRDLVRAGVLAIEKENLGHEVFLLSGSTEFTKEDVPELRTNPRAVVERYYPGACDKLAEYGDGDELQKLFDSRNLWKIDDISHSRKVLGWEPTYNFRNFYDGLMADAFPKDYMFREMVTTGTDADKAIFL